MNHRDYNGFFSGRTVLVTGGAGFIGSHLTQHLAGLNCRVRVLDDLSSGYKSNLEGIDAILIEGSILDESTLDRAMKDCSIVFHEAAMVSVPMSIEDPQFCNLVNVTGTKNVVESATNAGCGRIVFASSAACYGSNPTLPSSEGDQLSAESPYAQSKIAGEHLMEGATGIDTVSLRYFNVFGDRQDPTSQYAAVVSAFSDAIGQHQTPVIFGDGSQTRDFTHVSNVVHANLLAAAHDKPMRGCVFNVGTGNTVSVLKLLQLMQHEDEPDVHFHPTRQGDVQHSCANIDSIQKELGYHPIVETADAIMSLLNPRQN
jgi:UDP-glucose 4-epimerase